MLNEVAACCWRKRACLYFPSTSFNTVQHVELPISTFTMAWYTSTFVSEHITRVTTRWSTNVEPCATGFSADSEREIWPNQTVSFLRIIPLICVLLSKYDSPVFDVFVFVFFLGENEEVMVLDEPVPSRKRKAEETQPEVEEQKDLRSVKRARVSDEPQHGGDDDIIVLWQAHRKLQVLPYFS